MAYLNELNISSEVSPPEPPSVDGEYEQILWQYLDLFGIWDRVGMPSLMATLCKNPHRPHELDTKRFSTDINDAFNEKRGCLPNVMRKICSLESSFNEEKRFIDEFACGDVKDVITLNVSGTTMVTKRSTLLFFEESALAKRFDDSKWTEQVYTNMLVKRWSAHDVCAWANNIEGIQGNVGSILNENSITGCELLSLNTDGLRLLGIERVGSVCLLLKEIDLLKKASQDITSLIDHCPHCFEKILDYLRWKQQYHQGLVEDKPEVPKVRSSKRNTL